MKIVILLVVLTNLMFANNKNISLKEAINIALENNKQNKISKIALEIAQAQYKQALSANYPTINAMIAGHRVKEDTNFQMKGDISLPADIGKSLALSNLLSVPGMTLVNAQNQINSLPAGTFNSSNIKLDTEVTAYGRDTIKSSINMVYALYTGGKISSLIEQAKLNKLLAMNSIKRSNETVILDVKKYFYGFYLTNELHKIAQSTLNRMEYISELTKEFYESGESLNVKKTDYLSIQVTVALIESIVAKLEANKTLVKSALINSLGLPYDSQIDISYDQEDLLPTNYKLDELVKEAYKTNSDIRKMDIALKISSEQIKEQEAGHLPSIGLMGSVSNTYNSYEFGVLNDDQSNSWDIGFAATLPLFDGLRTTNKINEKKLEQKKLYLIQDMLKEGVSLQIKNELTNALIGYKQVQTLKKARNLAKQNRVLNIKGYQIDAIEPQKVIEAQYIEAYVKADYLKYVHDYLISLSKIDNLVGVELKK